MKSYRTTPQIERAAERLGANRNQIYLWRQRGVPEMWQLLISQTSRGRISITDFPETMIAERKRKGE